MEVYILTEGGSSIGFGHVTRCISIYQALEEKGVKPILIVNGDDSLTDILRNFNFEIFDWLTNRDRIFKKVGNSDIVLIDSYLADQKFYKDISTIIKLPVFYDDYRRIDYTKGIVINGNIYANELNYAKTKNISYLLGPKYLPLRKEFWYIPEKKVRTKVENILITFGGSDLRNMTPRILKFFVHRYPDLNKIVIVGNGFKNTNEIRSVVDKRTELIYNPNAMTMRDMMLEADIAISAGGQTLYELARVGVPTIAIAVAENQLLNVHAFKNAGFIEYAGWWEDESLFNNLVNCFHSILDVSVRKDKVSLGRKIVDGLGSLRIAERISLYESEYTK